MTFEDMLNYEPYKSCYEKGLAEGEAKGREDALEEFRKKINNYLTESTDFADFVVTDGAIDCVIDEMKGCVEE